MKTKILFVLVAALTGCASVHRSASGRVTADYNGGARGAVSVMEASADIGANDASLDICREAAVAQRPCMAFHALTGRLMVVVGGGVIPYGYFGVGGSYLDAAAAIAESRRLQRENAALLEVNAGLRSDVSKLSK